VEEGQEEDVTAVVAFLLLVVMFVIGSSVHGARSSFWKLLAFVTACLVVLALLFLILAK
jgi:Ca2+/Na+ antiporter